MTPAAPRGDPAPGVPTAEPTAGPPPAAPPAAPAAPPAAPAAPPAAPAPPGARLRRFEWALAGCGAALVAGAAAIGGVDFAESVLLGSALVLANYWWTRRTARSLLAGGRAGGALLLASGLKLAGTAALLYVALVPLAMDVIGVALGVSTLALAGLLYGLLLRLGGR